MAVPAAKRHSREDLLDEKAALERELADAESKLLGEFITLQSLNAENTAKIEKLKSLETGLEDLLESQAHEIELLKEEHSVAHSELAYESAVLLQEVRQLTTRQHTYKEMEKENEEIRVSVAKTLEKVLTQSTEHALKVHETKRELLSLRQTLESTFRKTLTDLDGGYQQKAFLALEESKKKALMENSLLQDELALQEKGKVALLKRCKQEAKEAFSVSEQFKVLEAEQGATNSLLLELQSKKLAREQKLAELQEHVTSVQNEGSRLKQLLRDEGVRYTAPQEVSQRIAYYLKLINMSKERVQAWLGRVEAAREITGKASAVSLHRPQLQGGAASIADSAAITVSNMSFPPPLPNGAEELLAAWAEEDEKAFQRCGDDTEAFASAWWSLGLNSRSIAALLEERDEVFRAMQCEAKSVSAAERPRSRLRSLGGRSQSLPLISRGSQLTPKMRRIELEKALKRTKSLSLRALRR